MFKLFFRLRYVAGIALFITSFLGYRLVKVEMSDHERFRADLADKLAEKASGEFPELEGNAAVTVAPLIDDEDDSLAASLRNWLHRRGGRVVEPGLVDVARQFVTSTPAARSVADARQAATAVGARYVVFGSVDKLNTTPESFNLEATLKLLDAESGKIIYDQIVFVPERNIAGSDIADSVGSAMLSGHGLAGVGIWMLILLLFPLAASRPIARVLKKQSNGANATMLLVYGSIAILLGWLLWAGSAAGLLDWLCLLVATGISFVYFGYICRKIERVSI